MLSNGGQNRSTSRSASRTSCSSAARTARVSGASRRSPAARQDRPRLRDRVDAALAARSPSPRASRRRGRRAGTRRRPTRAPRSSRAAIRPAPATSPPPRASSARVAERGEAIHRRAQEPAEPDALAAPLRADAVHPVVPVAVAHQRETVRALGQRALERASAVLEERTPRRADASYCAYRSCSSGASGSPVEERHRLVEDRRVAGGAATYSAVTNGSQSHVVRAARPHAATGRWVPPVQDVAFLELMRGRFEDVRARHVGRCVEQRQDVLELVADTRRRRSTDRSPCDRRRATTRRLVEQPAVEHQVHRRLRRLDADVPEHAVPERAQARSTPRRPRRGRGSARRARSASSRLARLPENEVRLDLLRRARARGAPGAPRTDRRRRRRGPRGPSARAPRAARSRRDDRGTRCDRP